MKKIHYYLGLRDEKQRETNANNLLEWYEKLPENAKKMNEGVKIYATQLKNSLKGVKKMVIGMPFCDKN